MSGKPLITNEDVESFLAAVVRGVVSFPRLAAWVVAIAAVDVFVSARAGVTVVVVAAAAWALLYAVPGTRKYAGRAWRHAGPAADLLRLRVGWAPGSSPDRRARKKGAQLVRNLAPAARDAGQSIKHMNPNGTVRYNDPRGVSLDLTTLGVRLIASPTKRHAAEGLAKIQDAYASRLGVQAPECLTATVLDQKRVSFDWEYLDPYEGTRMGAAIDSDSQSRSAA
jgi:hypothetical protein